jgi:hypothetical protein
MSVLKRPASIVLTIAAVAAAVGMVAPAASAAPRTWTIFKGGAVTAATKSFTFVDVTRNLSLPCKASTAKARLKSGRHLSGVNAGVITAASASGCAVAGFKITIKAGHLPWHLNLVSYNAAKGVTTGTLTGIHISFAVPLIGATCTAVVDGTKATANNGSVVVTYTNKTAKLAILKAGTKLHLFSVSKGCMGLVKNGDLVAIVATYSVTPKQKITSP